MTAIGKTESSDETQEKWEIPLWSDIAKNIDEDHQVPTLLSLIGGKTYIVKKSSDIKNSSYEEFPGDRHNRSTSHTTQVLSHY